MAENQPRQTNGVTSPESRKLTRRRVVAIVVLLTSAFLLGLGLVGQSVAVPRAVTVPAGLVALVGLIFVIPAGALYGLVRERRVGKSTSYQIWIPWRWRFAIAGGWSTLIAFVLLLPSAGGAYELKIVGIVALVWGLLCIWVAVLAFRAKTWHATTKS